MRWLWGFLIFVLLLVVGGACGYFYLKDYPQKLYSQWLRGEGWNRYYSISGFKDLYLRPSALEEIPAYQEDYVQLWRDFPIGHSLIPLPTRHPLFQTIPIIDFKEKNQRPQLGMIITGPDKREISRIYTLPTGLYQDHSMGQELFKLPFVRNRILKKNIDTVWNDIFTYVIEPKKKPLDDMIYDLYILHLRSKLFPKEVLRYGMLNGGRAVMELESADKDYRLELSMNLKHGSLNSYVIKTEKSNPDSLKLRAKFLQNITFVPVDKGMGKILYMEFKQLNFARQIDQEGMLYLFSAWSQDIENKDMVKDMVYYLERGRNNGEHLKKLYKFAFDMYGKTFTTLKEFSEDEDQNMALQRKIEIEAVDKKLEAQKAAKVKPTVPELTPEEKMNLYLRKAKEEGAKEPAPDMTIH